MSQFLTELDCELRDDDCIWVLKKPLVYKSDLVGIITAPEGFEMDFASVPRLPIIYSLFGDRAHREAVIHDLNYRIDAANFINFKDGIPKEMTFSLANDVFLEGMTCRKKSAIVRYGMYWGVCLGGKSSFHKRKVMDKL